MDNKKVSFILLEQAWEKAIKATPGWNKMPSAQQLAMEKGHDVGFITGYEMGRRVALEQVHVLLGELEES